MITEKNSTVSLRIMSRILSCSDITKLLDWEPTKTFEKGDLFGGRNNKRPREDALWVYQVELDEKVLFEEKLVVLIKIILDKRDRILEILEKCDIDIFCSYSTYNTQGGITLEAPLMKDLSLLNINLSIDFYALNDEDK